MDASSKTATTAAVTAVATNELLQRTKLHQRMLPGQIGNVAAVGVGGAAVYGSTKMEHGYARGAVLGFGIGAALTGAMDFFGL